MGRQRKRRQERRAARRDARGSERGWAPPFEPSGGDEEMLELFLAAGIEQTRPEALCGNCTEFVEDESAGRGSCLHPGSGVFAPWTDTPGCDFFAPRRRRNARPWS